MCPSCGRVWTALQILWSTVYICCGALQLMAGIFFAISVHDVRLYSILLAGSWNIITGIGGGMAACICPMSPRRQEGLLYTSFTILTVNAVCIIMTEWWLYFADLSKLFADYQGYSNHVLTGYVCFVTRIAAPVVLVAAFLDSQLAFYSMQAGPRRPGKKARGSHEQVSDIEYIIPRPKSSKPHTVYNAYAQSWVFDAENAGCSSNGGGGGGGGAATPSADAPYAKALHNGTPARGGARALQNGDAPLVAADRPVVQVEEASDDSNSNSDRKLCHMKSFSRSPSPVVLSASSSQASLGQPAAVGAAGAAAPSAAGGQAPIYEYLEKLTEPAIYRSRLDTAVSGERHYHAPQAATRRGVGVESVSPHAEKVQYASLMKELQRAIVGKKSSPPTAGGSGSTRAGSKSSSRQDSSRSDGKGSDAEFSKELEAALQLIQDLESPNTGETPSDAVKSPLEARDVRPLAVWRGSDASESEKTLSAVGSLVEIGSPLADAAAAGPPPELTTFKPSLNGKGASVAVHYPDSQSTSGYSSPTHHHSGGPTPDWSTTSSINGSSADIVRPISYSIHNAKSTTVISLYSQPDHLQAKGKAVTLVKICGDTRPLSLHNSTLVPDGPNNADATFNVTDNSPVKDDEYLTHRESRREPPSPPQQQQQPPTPTPPAATWSVKSLLRKKKQSTLPKLRPELEAAIVKSESLAYLSDLELIARHQRNQEIQREIEERVIQQLGVPRTESHC